jgi:hypothetical protein
LAFPPRRRVPFGPKRHCSGKVSWEWKDYDNQAREDWDGVIAEANVIWKYREPSQVRIFGGRANIESLFEGTNYYVSTYVGAEVRHFLS